MTGPNAKQFLENVVDHFYIQMRDEITQTVTKTLMVEGPRVCRLLEDSSSSCLPCSSLTLSIWLCDGRLPVCVDCTPISDSQCLTAGCVQATVPESEFGRAINSRVLFHSVTGQLCQGEDVAQDPNSITNMVKQN